MQKSAIGTGSLILWYFFKKKKKIRIKIYYSEPGGRTGMIHDKEKALVSYRGLATVVY